VLEWEVFEEPQPLPELPPEEAPPARSRRFWLTLALGVALLVLLILWVLRQEMSQRRAAMRADLTEFIRREEQARAFGLRDQAPTLITPGVTWEWWVNYLASFLNPGVNPRPLDIQVTDVRFDGEGALVTLTINGSPQMRYYRLMGQEWRRAMLPVEEVWGTRRVAITPIEGLSIIYRPPIERPFGQRLGKDLITFYDDVLPAWPASPQVTQIEIEPRDVAPPLISAAPERLVVNSPLLVPQDGVLSGEGAVRLALAVALLDQADGIETPGAAVSLLNASRFLKAAHTVVAMHWALSPEEHEALLAEWRRELNTWASPFEAIASLEEAAGGAAALIRRTNAAALFAAEYLYETAGPRALPEIVARLPYADTWDELFQDTVGQPRRAVEEGAATFAGVPGAPASTGLAPGRPPAEGAGGIEAELVTFGPGRLVRGLVDGQSVEIRLPAKRNAFYADGQPVAAGCLGIRSRVRLEGSWKVQGEQFQAERLTVTRAKLPLSLRSTPPPPPPAVYVVRQTPFRPAEILAVGADGTIASVLELEQAVHVRARPQPNGALHFVITFFVPGCDRYWVVVYAPRQGIVAKWLSDRRPAGEARFFHTIWLPESEEMFFLTGGPAGGTWRYRLDRADRSRLTAEPVARLRRGLLPLEWSARLGQLVTFDMSASRPTLVLVEPTGDEAQDILLPATPFDVRLSPDGRRLAFTVRFRRTEGPPDTLMVLDLADGSQKVLWSSAIGEGLGEPAWAQDADLPKVAVPLGPLAAEGEEKMFSSIYTFTFEGEGRPSPEVTLFSQLRELVGVVPCGDGSLVWAYRDKGEIVLAREQAGTREVTRLAFPSAQVLGCEWSRR